MLNLIKTPSEVMKFGYKHGNRDFDTSTDSMYGQLTHFSRSHDEFVSVVFGLKVLRRLALHASSFRKAFERLGVSSD